MEHGTLTRLSFLSVFCTVAVVEGIYGKASFFLVLVLVLVLA